MLSRLSFKNKRAGRPKRAAFYLRWARQIRRKRVAYARAMLWDTLKLAQRQKARFEELAKLHDVPVAEMAPLPPIPELPGQKWVEHLQDMGDLKDPVIAPAASIGEARA